MTRYKRRQGTAMKRFLFGVIILGVIALMIFACAEFSKETGVDDTIANLVVASVVVKPASYIVEVEKTETMEMDKPYTEDDVIALAKMAYGEAFVTKSDTEMSASMWCVCNRPDSGNRFYEGCESVFDIVTQDCQFYGYNESNPVDEHLVWLARDVLDRWVAEQNGADDVGRTLPQEYCFFWGDGLHNHFTTEHLGGIEYDWSLPSPYES